MTCMHSDSSLPAADHENSVCIYMRTLCAVETCLHTELCFHGSRFQRTDPGCRRHREATYSCGGRSCHNAYFITLNSNKTCFTVLQYHTNGSTQVQVPGITTSSQRQYDVLEIQLLDSDRSIQCIRTICDRCHDVMMTACNCVFIP